MGPQKIVRVVIDTNVVVSALLFGGTPGKLLSMWKTGKLLPFMTGPIVEEYLKVLAYPRFGLTEAEINFLVYRQILPYFEVVSVGDDTLIIEADPADDKFLHCAVAAKADALVSGDRHLLNLQRYKNILILSPSRLLEQLDG